MSDFEKLNFRQPENLFPMKISVASVGWATCCPRCFVWIIRQPEIQ
ncbi:MAG: hypothetical protein IJ187_09470 [Neisseriaceae bacterium]|nr:hypothetical protein [Neisseriaceae bacterium]